MKKILVIDDDLLPTDYYLEALRRRGFSVSQCSCLDDARNTWQELKPDLIILDVMMAPGLKLKASETKEGLHSGVVLYKMLREDRIDARVIILTNLQYAGDLFKGEGVVVLQKASVPPFELAAVANRVLEGSRNE